MPEALRACESMRWERVSSIGKVEQVCCYPGLPPYALRYRLCVIARLPDSVSLRLMGSSLTVIWHSLFSAVLLCLSRECDAPLQSTGFKAGEHTNLAENLIC